MAVQTPEYWKEKEFQPLIEETTAYGTKVRIPKKWHKIWKKMKRMPYSQQEMMDGYHLLQKQGQSMRADLLLTFYEAFQKRS